MNLSGYYSNMQAPEFFVLWAIIAFLLIKGGNLVIVRYRQHCKARSLGCGVVPTYTPGDPLGVYSLYEAVKAVNEDRFPEYLVQRGEYVSRRECRPVTTFWSTTGGETSIFTCEPRNMQAILATQFRDFELGELRKGAFRPLLGHGIFASDGKQWEHARAMLRPQFARNQINDLSLEEKHVRNMIKALSIDSEGWTTVTDLKPLFFRLTIDAATEFLFGESVQSQVKETGATISKGPQLGESEKQFSRAFDTAQHYIFRSGRMGKLHRLGQTPEFERKVQDVHDFIDYYVGVSLDKTFREEVIRQGNVEKQEYVFLDAIAEETQDPIELRDALLNILLAGRDTTASLLSWVMLVLSRNEAIFDKLRTIVLADFGGYDDTREITFEKLKNCSYLQWTLNETLRLYPVVPVNQRAATTDTTLPVGGGPDGAAPVFIPKGTEVYYSIFAMHRRKDLWGDDAHEFHPERWMGKKYGWEYLPFNGGPRICLGQQFALTEAGYVIVRLLQKFDKLSTVHEGRGIGHRMTLTCAPTEVRLRMREARG